MPHHPHATRDLVGYGRTLPHAHWPGDARACVSFVLNYEEGGEHTLLNGDLGPETYLTEYGAPSGPAPEGVRNLSVESAYAYGARRGFWRVLELFEAFRIPFTSWAVGRAVEVRPDAVAAMEAAGGEVGSHAYRWIDYTDVPEEEERTHITHTIDLLHEASPSKHYPLGWYTGRPSLQTRRLVYEEYKRRGLHTQLYDSDAYDEDLPYYLPAPDGTPNEHLLVVPYTLDVNDMKFANTPGFAHADAFYQYLVDTLDTLLLEGATTPRMMTIGLHARIIGRPGRITALRRFLTYLHHRHAALQHAGHGGIWVATRGAIADHWRRTHPPTATPA